MMLLIVINHEQPQKQQATQNAAQNLRGRSRFPKCPGLCEGEEKRRGKDAPPTLECGVVCEFSGGED